MKIASFILLGVGFFLLIISIIYYRKFQIKKARVEYRLLLKGRNFSDNPERKIAKESRPEVELFARKSMERKEEIDPSKERPAQVKTVSPEVQPPSDEAEEKGCIGESTEILTEKTAPSTSHSSTVTEVLVDDSGSTEILDSLEETVLLEEKTVLLTNAKNADRI